MSITDLYAIECGPTFRSVFTLNKSWLNPTEKLKTCLEKGTTAQKINEFQQLEGIDHSVLKILQLKQKSFLWPLRWREIQTHTFPRLESPTPQHSRSIVRALLLHQQQGFRDERDEEKWEERSEGKQSCNHPRATWPCCFSLHQQV